jgi:hypothetical protein
MSGNNNFSNYQRLPVDRLGAVYKNVTSSYKYYCFISTLDELKKQAKASCLLMY